MNEPGTKTTKVVMAFSGGRDIEFEVPRVEEEVDYSQDATPSWYHCEDCGASGVRLFRDSVPFCDKKLFHCASCLCGRLGKSLEDAGSRRSIGSYVCAIPLEKVSYIACWSLMATPGNGYRWWGKLPLARPAAA